MRVSPVYAFSRAFFIYLQQETKIFFGLSSIKKTNIFDYFNTLTLGNGQKMLENSKTLAEIRMVDLGCFVLNSVHILSIFSI